MAISGYIPQQILNTILSSATTSEFWEGAVDAVSTVLGVSTAHAQESAELAGKTDQGMTCEEQVDTLRQLSFYQAGFGTGLGLVAGTIAGKVFWGLSAPLLLKVGVGGGTAALGLGGTVVAFHEAQKNSVKADNLEKLCKSGLD